MPNPEPSGPPPVLTCFMLVQATPDWLAMPPAERFGFVDRTIRPLLARHPAVSLRYFDAEAFNARISDVMMWQSSEMSAWLSLVEGLRETPFWGRYFEVVEIVPSVEDGYASHYGVTPAGR